MPDTIAALVPLLQPLAASAGAGIAAYYLLCAARQLLPAQPVAVVAAMPPLRAFVYSLLYTPIRVRLVVFALTALISLVASTLIAALTGADVARAFDAALAVVINQIWHGWRDLPTDPQFAAVPQSVSTSPERRFIGWDRQDDKEFHS